MSHRRRRWRLTVWWETADSAPDDAGDPRETASNGRTPRVGWMRLWWRRVHGTRRVLRASIAILTILLSTGVGDQAGLHGLGPRFDPRFPPPPGWPAGRPYYPMAGGSGGTTYYIATTGTDTSNAVCSLASPCASLTHFSAGQGGPALVAGDTVQIQNGTYNLAYSGGAPSAGQAGLWSLSGIAGTPSAPITIQGQSQAGVIIQRENPASDNDQSVRLLTISGSIGTTHDLTFTQLTFKGMTGRSDYNSNCSGVGGSTPCVIPGLTWGVGASEIEYLNAPSTGASDITFDHITVQNTPAGCFKTGFATTIQYSTMTGCGQYSTMHSVYAGYGGNVLDHNTVTNGSGQSLYTDNTTVGNAMTVTNNIVQGNGTPINFLGSNGIQVADPGSLIQGNIVYDGYCNGIQVGGGSGSTDATHPITVEQNVIANWNVGGGSCTGLTLVNPGYDVIYNNTFFGQGTAINANGAAGGTVAYKNNIFAAGAPGVGSPQVYFFGTAGSVEDYNMFFNVTFQAGSNITAKGAHDLTADPAFVNAPYVASPTATTALPDVHLTNGSPAVDAGVNVGLLYNSTAPDMGAYESPYTASVGGGGGGTTAGAGVGGGPSHVGHW